MEKLSSWCRHASLSSLLALIWFAPGCGTAEPTSIAQSSRDATTEVVNETDDQSEQVESQSREETKPVEETNLDDQPMSTDDEPQDETESESASDKASKEVGEVAQEQEVQPTAEPVNPIPKLDPDPFRIFIPTTKGPLIVDVDIRLDDISLVTAFENRIKQLITDADKDESKTLSWPEFLDHIDSDPEQFGRNAANRGNRRNVIQLQDRNRNGRADYEEVVRMLFRDSGFSTPFRLQGTDYYRGRKHQSKLFALLDRDQSESLEQDEIDLAANSLRRADSNTDQRLDITEIIQPMSNENTGRMNTNEDPAWNRRRTGRDASVATDIFGYIDWTMASYSFTDIGTARPFSLPGSPMMGLDQNENGSVSKEEAKGLLKSKPDVVLRAELFSDYSSDPKLSILWARTELQPLIKPQASTTSVLIVDDTMRFQTRLTDKRIGRQRIPIEAFAMLDANNDGGLDEAEIPDQFEDQYSFEDYDADNDGKLTLNEINEGMQPKAPIWSIQVRGRGAEFPDAYFAYLDQNDDLALSTREIAAAGERLETLASGGTIAPDAVPNTFLIQLVRGDPMQRNQLFAFESTPPLAAGDDVPHWAKSMDANNDGEISGLEFPGSKSQFDKLDKNHDGFIDLSEVKQAA